MRARVYWPVTLAAALLVGLLAYGLTTTGTDTTLDSAMARGDRVDPPTRGPLPVLGGNENSSLADYKRPRWVEFIAELPKTPTGKVQRFKLRELKASQR